MSTNSPESSCVSDCSADGAGDHIITGSFTCHFLVTPGDCIGADFDRLSPVEATFAPDEPPTDAAHSRTSGRGFEQRPVTGAPRRPTIPGAAADRPGTRGPLASAIPALREGEKTRPRDGDLRKRRRDQHCGEHLRVVPEGAGATALAALVDFAGARPNELAGKSVVVLISGGNIDINTLGAILQRGQFADTRLAHIRFTVADLPGELGRIASVLGEAQINIVEVHHSRLAEQLRVGSALIDFIVEMRGIEHVNQTLHQLHEKGFAATLVRDV